MAKVINNHGRQWMLHAVADVLHSNVTAASGGTSDSFTITIPPNGLLDTLTVDTVTAFNTGGGTPVTTMTIGDGTTTFANAVDITSAGRETVANIGKFYPNGGTLTVTITASAASAYAAPTAGESIVAAGYLVVGRANEVQV